MFSRTTIKSPLRQQGLAVLVLIIFVLLGMISYALSDLSIVKVRIDNAHQTQIALKQARQALINYALVEADIDVSRAGKFGFLPCPDYTSAQNEGIQDGNCGAVNTSIAGWLPVVTLGLPKLKDDSGACLMYAVTGSYKQSPETAMLNEDNYGQFQVVDEAGNPLQGALPENRIVAVVFAAGDALSGQSRAYDVNSYCGNDYNNEASYLEGNGITNNAVLNAVADSVDQFIHATDSSADDPANPYNDRFLTISRDDIWQAIVERNDFRSKMENLTQALAMCLVEYSGLTANRRLPWPALTNLGARTNYRDNINYVDINKADVNFAGYSGRYPFRVPNSNGAIDPATLTEDEIFKISGTCDVLDIGGGVIVDLETAGSEYRILWENWKDHFYYVLSKKYEPDNTGAIKCSAPNSCIQVNTTQYAAAVIFSGSRLNGVSRNDKSSLLDYLEDGKATEFINEQINKTGDGAYTYTDPQTETRNDIMYCIENNNIVDDLSVVECS